MCDNGARYSLTYSKFCCIYSSAFILMLKIGPEMPYPQDHSCAIRRHGIKCLIATFPQLGFYPNAEKWPYPQDHSCSTREHGIN